MIPFPESRRAKVLPVLVLSHSPFLCRDQIPGLEKIQGEWTQRRGLGFQATSKGQGEEGGGHQGCPLYKAGVWHKDPSCWLNAQARVKAKHPVQPTGTAWQWPPASPQPAFRPGLSGPGTFAQGKHACISRMTCVGSRIKKYFLLKYEGEKATLQN